MQIGVVGKTNTGKSTFFSAATLVDAEISNRVFTTIKPNRGVSYVRAPCPCRELGVECQPQNSKCIDGVRLIPVKLIDVAGLVPGAHEGRGLGNQFLSDIMEADALINVIDASGGTDDEGNPVEPGTHDPRRDISFLEKEIDYWFLGLLKKNWSSIRRKAETGQKLHEMIFSQLSGLKITEDDVKEAMREFDLKGDDSDKNLFRFATRLRIKSKPIIIAANKIDVPSSIEKIKTLDPAGLIPCSAESELALRRADKNGIIKYIPGDPDFILLKESGLEDKQKEALEFIKSNVLERFGSTGVQRVINSAVFDLLKMIVVYPVENENRYASGKGHVLPDAYLVPRGTTPKELAGRIHTEFADRFVAAVDARTKKRIGADQKLKNGDIVKIMLKK